ncbi:hypothetical protein N7492_008200 [Penicillium capsulatum]|uniref:Uncharacterized protein n=1 Tax=Penicillium capsulatum TaxID=69766 RepID=A0A9W9LGU7_9EURO|nr:hypothetical protein N7492_008200 [Penicillium capsulatum]KAJ6105610.1 hypothetical protein N7512_009127 [Penicillium capsulatum]
MKSASDRKSKETDHEIVQRILDRETSLYFQDLEDDELFSGKHRSVIQKHKRQGETDAQREALRDATEGVWNSLQILCSATDLKALKLSYMKTKEQQDALKLAISNGSVDKDFLHKFIPVKWTKFLDAKKRQARRKELKLEKQRKERSHAENEEALAKSQAE